MRHLEFLQMQNSVLYMSHSYSIAPVSIQCINTDLACESSLLYSSVIILKEIIRKIFFWAQLFKGRLALIQG